MSQNVRILLPTWQRHLSFVQSTPLDDTDDGDMDVNMTQISNWSDDEDEKTQDDSRWRRGWNFFAGSRITCRARRWSREQHESKEPSTRRHPQRVEDTIQRNSSWPWMTNKHCPNTIQASVHSAMGTQTQTGRLTRDATVAKPQSTSALFNFIFFRMCWI